MYPLSLPSTKSFRTQRAISLDDAEKPSQWQGEDKAVDQGGGNFLSLFLLHAPLTIAFYFQASVARARANTPASSAAALVPRYVDKCLPISTYVLLVGVYPGGRHV